MNLFLVIAGIAFVIWLVSVLDRRLSGPRRKKPQPPGPRDIPRNARNSLVAAHGASSRQPEVPESGSHSTDSRPTDRSRLRASPRPAPPAGHEESRTFRPASATLETPIRFRESPVHDARATATSVSGLVDAFTGAALDPTSTLYQCDRCRAYYQQASFDEIQRENQGQCVACLSPSLRAIPPAVSPAQAAGRIGAEPPEPGRPTPEAQIVSFSSYPRHAGRVVLFEGPVRKVLASWRGDDYAIMFEDADWTAGLKAVVRGWHLASAGGETFLRGLTGRRIRVRGILQKHEILGYQILVSERRMIEVLA